MDCTISSITTMCLLNSLLVLLLCLVFKRNEVLRRVGPKCIIILLLITLIRMFLPFEFSYTHSIRVGELLSPLRRLLLYPLLQEPFELTVWQLFVFLWAAGVVIQVNYKLHIYQRITRLLSLQPKEEWDQFCEKYELDPADVPIDKNIKIVYHAECQSPCLIGYKRPYLVLPAAEYKKEQIRYIVMHEMMHAKNRDIVWKLGIDWLCVIFWWNPVFWYLKRELFQLIEMRNDILIADRLSRKERAAYMECLKDLAMQMVKKDIASSVAFSRNDLNALKRRMKLIAGYKSFSRGRQIVLSLLVCIILFMTSMVVFEPYSLKKIAGEGIPITSDSAYLIRNEDKFDVYVNGQYIITIEDGDLFKKAKIYDDVKEAHENE